MMDEGQKKVEAVLFAVGKEITSERIGALCKLDISEVEAIMLTLQQHYSSSENSLQIVKKEDGWKLTVQDQFIPLVSSIVSSTELERPLMETLAVIAWRYPIVQSDVVKLRSASAYDHMKQLVEQGFISKERFGRTYQVKLTNKFFNYFDLPSAEAKEAFLAQIPAELLQEAEEVNKEADEVERLIEKEGHEKEAHSDIKDAMKSIQN